jgi:hypothetical protein
MTEVKLMTNAEYHADTENIGSSMLKKILSSPRDFYDLYVAKSRVQEPSDAMILGSAVDTLVFEPAKFGAMFTWRPDGLDGRKDKEGYAKYKESLLTKTELTPLQRDKAFAMASRVLEETVIQELLDNGEKQKTIHWLDAETGVPCKARLDAFISRPDMATDLILDLKTSSDPTPEYFGRGGQFGPMRKFHYGLQLAHYELAVYALTGRHAATGLIVVGSSPPHDTFLFDCGGWMEYGLKWRSHAIKTYLHCKETGIWRRPDQGIIIPIAQSPWDEPPEEE